MIKFSGQTTGGGGGATPDASETVKGKIRIATSAEASTGTNDLIAMTPKTVTDLIDAAVLGLFDYKGALDASQPTTPDISSGLKGDFYRISVAGTIYGKTWALNDALVINADMGGVVDNAKIDKFDNTDAVTSVNTFTGPVVLDSSNIAENTNLYYTDARVDTEVGTLPLSTLNDVSYTAGPGIDGDVLTWVNASSEWQAATPATAPVTSVNTFTGPVVLDSSNIAENTNLYYTDARVDTEVATLPLSTLSDVSYTGGAGIDGDVLTWVNANSRWEAVTSSASAAGLDVQTATTAVTAIKNTAYWFTAAGGSACTLTLPLSSTLVDGDTFVVTRMNAGSLVIQENAGDAGIVRFGSSLASSQSLTNNYQETVIRYASSVFYIFQDGGISHILEDTTPQLGGDLDVNSNSIVSVSNGDINLAPNGTGIIKTTGSAEPDASLTRSIGSESLRYLRTYSDVDGAIIFKGKNDSGVTLTKGQAVYVKGVSGTVPTVDKARANSASTMPAFGLVYANANDQAEVQIVTFGNLTDVNTTTYSLALGDTVYISAATAGALTNTAPASETNLIQNIGRVIRADASAGIIKVGGAGRSNATPNLDLDKIFVGNATHQTVSKSLSAIGLTELNQNLTTATVSEVTNLYYTDGRVDARAATLPLSTLSDVSYTGGAGIDGKVLTWVNASSEWQAVTASGGGGSAPTVTAQNTTTSLSAPGSGVIEQTYTVNSASAVVLTLVSAATTGAGFKYQVKRLGAGAVTAQPAGAEYIDYAGQTSFAVGAQYDSITLQSDGTNWVLI